MSKETRYLIVWFFLGGFISYLLAATLDATFLTILNQEEDWCAKIEKSYGGVDDSLQIDCVEYKDNVAFIAHTWNQKQADKKPWLLGTNYCVMLILTVLVINLIPKWREKTPLLEFSNEIRSNIKNYGGTRRLVDHNAIFGLMLYAFLITFVSPWIFNWILPPPIEWFPSFITDLEQSRVSAMMEALQAIRSVQEGR